MQYLVYLIYLLLGVVGAEVIEQVSTPASCQAVGDSIIQPFLHAGYSMAGEQPLPGGAGQVVILVDESTGDLQLVGLSFGEVTGQLEATGFSRVSICTTPDGGRAEISTKKSQIPAKQAGVGDESVTDGGGHG